MRHHRPLLLTLLALPIVAVGVDSLAGDPEILYARESAPIFAVQKGQILGQITPGTALTVKSKAAGKVEVEVEGWAEEYRELELFTGKENRIELAALVRANKKNLEVLGQEAGRYDSVWKRVKLTGWVEAKRLEKTLEAVWKPAREIHSSRCTECHDFMPASELNPQQWSGVLRIMTHRAALTPEEAVLLKQYLQAHAREKAE
jgi:hypothetical protein